MDERTRESISAFMDDEANELEIQRLLSKTGSAELLDTWQRYHKVQDLMSGMPERMTSIDVSAGVAAAIRGEVPEHTAQQSSSNDLHERGLDASSTSTPLPAKPKYSAFRMYGSAVAACMLLAVGLFYQPDSAQQDAVNSSNQGLVVNQLTAEQISSFNEYLLRHSEQSTVKVSSGMAPLIRVASVNSVGI